MSKLTTTDFAIHFKLEGIRLAATKYRKLGRKGFLKWVAKIERLAKDRESK